MPKPIVDKKKCNGCNTCVDICPMDVFVLDKDKKADPVKAKECIGCRACEFQCPQKAIVIKDEE